MAITIDWFSEPVFKKCMPLCQHSHEYYLPLLKAMDEGQINSPQRIAAFLAQIAHESQELKYWTELGNNSYFLKYEQGQLAIKLGNIHPGDGAKYKGRSPIQLTGRSNYRACGTDILIDLENNPDQAATPDVGFKIAVWFWNKHNLSELSDFFEFDRCTAIINGGQRGADQRRRYYVAMLPIITKALYGK